MKIPAQVCEKCRQERCDGVIYETVAKHPIFRGSGMMETFTMCKNSEEFCIRNGAPYYHQVFGHGDSSWWLAKERL